MTDYNNMEEWFKKLHEKCPFLTYGTYIGEDYIGIVQNCDNQIISLYIYNSINDDSKRKKFLELGDVWWWESNRQIPINIFLKKQFIMFKPYLKSFARKEFNIVYGPSVSLQDQITKRIKRKSIEIVKNQST